MKTAFLILIAIVVAGAIYWIMDLKKQHPDGD